MNCHACKCHVTPTPPRTMWKVAVVALWATSLVVSVVFGAIVGLNLVLLPALLGVGMAIGTATRRLTSWTCPRCNEELLDHAPAPDTAPLASAVHQT